MEVTWPETLGITHEEWRDSAACRTMDPAAFFPEPSDLSAIAAAIRVCRTCPVMVDCDRGASARREDYGVWGGRWRGPVKGRRGRPAKLRVV